MNCNRCGAPGAGPLDVVSNDGVVVAAGHLCSPCTAKVLEGRREYRRQFDELIAAGVDRRLANRIMIVRVDQHFARQKASGR